jgi:hypothetical protein
MTPDERILPLTKTSGPAKGNVQLKGRRNMNRLRMKFGALAIAGGAAAIVLAGVPAMASTHATGATSITGPEVIQGMVHGKAALANTPHIPLTLVGVVNTSDTGFVLGGGNATEKSLSTAAGKFTVEVTAKPQTSQTMNNKTCRFSETEDLSLSVLGSKSTKAFAGASGPGAVEVHFVAYASRYKSGPKKGQCNTSNNATPLTKGAVASFLGSFVLTVP